MWWVTSPRFVYGPYPDENDARRVHAVFADLPEDAPIPTAEEAWALAERKQE